MPHPMLHGLCLRGYAPYSHGLWSGSTKWIIRRIAHKRKSTSLLSYSKKWISFSYHLLPIIHVYDVGISRLRSYAWLWSYARLRSEDVIPVVCPTPVGRHDSGRMSRFRSTSRLWSYLLTLIVYHSSGRWVCYMSYHLSCERLRMAGLDDCSIL
jgi:hypothetical protein